MKCLFCNILTNEYVYECKTICIKCSTIYYFVNNKITLWQFKYSYKNNKYWIVANSKYNHIEILSHEKIICKLPYTYNITPYNINEKFPTILTFL